MRAWSGSRSRQTGSLPAPAATRRRARLPPFPDDLEPNDRCGDCCRAGWCSHSSRPESWRQDYLMYRYHARGGASLAVLGSALALTPSTIAAQTALPAVTVEAPRATAARPAARKPAVRSSARTQARPTSTNPAPSASLTAGITPSVARALLYQAPNGQTETTIDRSQFDNRPWFSVADVLRESPGISVKQGNGPRDIGISIRGSNARNGFGIRNLVIFDDGFPVTQPDGLSRSDLIDPRAYGAIDVIRGPSSALYGNYATGGALNFRTRPGGTIDGAEWRRWRQLWLPQQLHDLRQEGRQFRGLAVCERRT